MKLGIPLEVREGRWKEHVAKKTRLGWVIHGVSEVQDQAVIIHHFFSLENFGLAVESQDDKRAKHILKSTTIKSGYSYETGLLWRYQNVKLPPSYEMA